MIFDIYGKALSVLAKKPVKLWGVSLLCGFVFIPLSYTLGGPVLLIGVCASYLFAAAMANIYLKCFRGEEDFKVVDLFKPFKDFKTAKRVVCAMAWADLWKLLWLLIPIAGPVFFIIKTYEYRFVPYIITGDESLSPTEAKEISSKMTKGCKSTMFWADILFYVFVYVAFGILAVFARIPYIGVLFAIVAFLLCLCVIAFSGLFLNLVRAAFYDRIKNGQKEVYIDAGSAPVSEQPTQE